jgi:DNA-directed RNA polymerase alpha subunit
VTRLYVVLTDQRGLDILKLAGVRCAELAVPGTAALWDRPPSDRRVGPGSPFTDLELSVRTTNALSADGVNTVQDLALYTEGRLMMLPNLGKKGVKEIKDTLSLFNLGLAS